MPSTKWSKSGVTAVRPNEVLVKYLASSGEGKSIEDADGSSTPVPFKYTVPAAHRALISRVLIHVRGTNMSDAGFVDIGDLLLKAGQQLVFTVQDDLTSIGASDHLHIIVKGRVWTG